MDTSLAPLKKILRAPLLLGEGVSLRFDPTFLPFYNRTFLTWFEFNFEKNFFFLFESDKHVAEINGQC